MAQARRGPPRYDYTKGSIIRGITRLSVPAFGEQFTYNIETIVEVYWVGQLGSDHLAALSIAYMFLMFSRMVGFGVRVAGQALVAQQIGGGDGERASLMAGQTIVLSLAVSALITVLGLWFAPNIMGLMTSDPRLVRLGTGYLYASFALFAFVDGNFMLAHLVRGAGEPAYSLAGMTVAAAAAAILVPVFVLGIGPVPRLELTGAGLAIALARLMGAGTIAYFFLARRSRLAVRLRHFRPRWEIFRLLVSLAWPISAQNVFERGGNLIMLRMLSPFGSLVLAAWGVADRVSTMARMPSFGIQGAVRTMVGQNVGAARPHRALRSAWVAVGFAVAVMGGTSAAFGIWANPVVRFFGMEGEAARLGTLYLRIFCAGVVFESVRRVLAGVFQGASLTKPPMVVEVAVRWGVQLPGAYLAAFPLGLGALSILWSVPGYNVIGSLALFVWFLKLRFFRSQPGPKVETA